MIKGTKKNVDELLKILETFSETSDMKINWEKSYACWFDRYTYKPDWFLRYN